MDIENIEEIKTETKVEVEEKRPLAERLDNAYKGLKENEKLAWNQGWRPQEFFSGKNRDGSERQWIDADTFLNKNKENAPVVNDRNRELAKEVDRIKAAMKEERRKRIEAEKRGYERALEELTKKQMEAVESADTETFKELRKKEEEVRKYAPIEIEEEESVVDKIIEGDKPQTMNLTEKEQIILGDWYARNSWYATDEKLASYAAAAERDLLKSKPHLSLSERLELVSEEVKEVFHAKFNNTTPKMFSGGGVKGFGDNSPKQKGYNDLSVEDKKNCDNLIKLRGIDRKGQEAVKEFQKKYADAIYKSN